MVFINYFGTYKGGGLNNQTGREEEMPKDKVVGKRGEHRPAQQWSTCQIMGGGISRSVALSRSLKMLPWVQARREGASWEDWLEELKAGMGLSSREFMGMGEVS